MSRFRIKLGLRQSSSVYPQLFYYVFNHPIGRNTNYDPIQFQSIASCLVDVFPHGFNLFLNFISRPTSLRIKEYIHPLYTFQQYQLSKFKKKITFVALTGSRVSRNPIFTYNISLDDELPPSPTNN